MEYGYIIHMKKALPLVRYSLDIICLPSDDDEIAVDFDSVYHAVRYVNPKSNIVNCK